MIPWPEFATILVGLATIVRYRNATFKRMNGANHGTRTAGNPTGFTQNDVRFTTTAVTVIITTSAAESNPSTDLIEIVMKSLVLHEPLLKHCRKLIICDCPTLAKPGNKVKYKSGIVDQNGALLYEEYKSKLKSLASENTGAFTNCTVVELRERQGFAMAVKHALSLTTTPLVMVVQHDRALVRSFGLLDAVRFLMIAEHNDSQHARFNDSQAVQYLGLKNFATRNYHYYIKSRYQLDINTHARTMRNEGDLLPLLFWYDSTHLARVDYYNNFVFGYIKTPRGSFKLRRGNFIEDSLGQAQLNCIKKLGMDEHARFGTFLLNDGPLDDAEDMTVLHINGRNMLRTKRNLENYSNSLPKHTMSANIKP